MDECLLCEKDMKVSNGVFGSGCIKNIYKFLKIKKPRKAKYSEEYLFDTVKILTHSRITNFNQRKWLTDRYLAYQYLDKIPYGNFDIIKNKILYDIQNISTISGIGEFKSMGRMSLYNAYLLYKRFTRFQKGLEQIRNGKFKDADSIKAIITSISFIFHMYRNGDQYEKSMFKGMQFAFWQTVIEAGRNYADFPISADFLQHSLEKKPDNLFITEGIIINDIIADKSFKENVKEIIDKYGQNNKFIFDSFKDNAFPMIFNDNDLYFAIHRSSLYIEGKKDNDKWNLFVKLHDRYDYSDPKWPDDYYNDTSSVTKSMLSSTLYNLASFSVLCGVLKEYDIDIEFSIEGFEVK